MWEEFMMNSVSLNEFRCFENVFIFWNNCISCINVSVMLMHTHVSVNSGMLYVKWCKCKLFLIEDVT